MSGDREKLIKKQLQDAYTKLCECGWRIFNGRDRCFRCEVKKTKNDRRLKNFYGRKG